MHGSVCQACIGLCVRHAWECVSGMLHVPHCREPAGVGWARLHTPHGIVDVFNTHLHANYSHKYERGQKHGQGQVEGRSSSPSSSSPLFKVPQDRFAAYRVSQVCMGVHEVWRDLLRACHGWGLPVMSLVCTWR